MKIRLFVLIILVAFAPLAGGAVKKADLAGSWYSGSKEALTADLEGYLRQARPPDIDGEIIALISPHAGFRYSGSVAAYGFKAIRNKGIKTVIVIGFSHRRYYDGVAVLDADGYKTPLGEVVIDRSLTKGLIDSHSKIYSYPEAFLGENSVEMEIPFLQAVLRDFKIVLVAIGNQSPENCKIAGGAVYNVLKGKKDSLIVASTDMCHYLPYDKANEIDSKTISAIKKFDPDSLYAESAANGHKLMCGYGATCAAMIASKKLGANKVKILKYANSGDTAGNKDGVVGYLSAALIRSDQAGSNVKIDAAGPKADFQNDAGGEKNMLNEAQRKKILKLARDTISHYLVSGERLDISEKDSVLTEEMGAFVTLHRSGQLRGCIGSMIGKGPLYLTIRNMAIEAATGDPRFRPVTLDEMKKIDIEISVLSPLVKIEDPEIIEPGKHGVLVQSRLTSGVYLPQVATEQGWNREEFLNSLCGHKAGMRPDAWKKGECDIYIFTAEVFGEKN